MCSSFVGHNWSFYYDDPNYYVCILWQTIKRELINNAVVGLVVILPQSLNLFRAEHFSQHLV